ncbi:hypothetical protein LTR53_000173 [Teratosphaeriaceae sp. CCFEE 6253]|nr:hypothetical protein LTR53_000173 [Teratosphaeriaceae sp. CCFEE 6253]
MSTISSVAFLGADSILGPAILQHLLSASFTVTVLKRQGSNSPDKYPSEVSIKRIPDDLPVDAVAAALQGHDALVVSIKGSQVDVQVRLANACVKANVSRLIPADFGSCDSSGSLTQRLVPLYKRKTELRGYLQSLAHQHPDFSWTSIVCGHFFDWSTEFIHLWPGEHRADILDDGEKEFSISTLSRVGEATARILQRPAETKNKMLYVHSFTTTQNKIVRAYEGVTKATFKLTRYQSEEYKNEQKAKADAGDKAAIEDLVWYLGTIDADWRTRENFAMDLLGLVDEDLVKAVEKAIQGP